VIERRTDDALFRLLVDRVVDYAIFLLTPDGRIASWNAGAERLKQYSAHEIIGQSFERFYTPADRAAGRPGYLLGLARTNGRVEDEGWRVRKDGTLFWADVVITALTDDYGQLRGFAKVTRDLTERREVEEQLRLSEQRFHSLVDSVTDYAIFLLTPEGHVASWNAGAERLKQYAADEIVGQSFERFYTPDDRAAGRPAMLLGQARTDGRVGDEGWRVRKDGSLFWADVVITALTDEHGNLIGFAKVTRDLTARRQAEQDRARQQAAERAADRIQHLQTATVVLASASSVEGAAMLLAEMATESLRAARSEVVLAATDDHPLADVLRSGNAVIESDWAGIPLALDRRALGVLGVYFDAPRALDTDERGLLFALGELGAQAIDRARLYESEQAARADAEAAVHAQEEFLSIAAHELRTPVAAIKATAQLAERAIRRGSLDPERTTRHLQSIARSSDRLGALIEDLLDVSRLRTGRLVIRRQTLDLGPLIQEVVDRYVGTASVHRFETDLPPAPVLVDADPLRLEQVLDNVLSNAVKYSPEGGMIAIGLRSQDGHALLTVTDHGIGVPVGQEERIFEVFGRASNAAAHQIQGLGLGLSICRQLVEMHGGRMWASGRGEDAGLAISVELPLATSVALPDNG
jgi:PAS domain S-box-containing protein